MLRAKVSLLRAAGRNGMRGRSLSILTNEKYKGDALLQKCFTMIF